VGFVLTARCEVLDEKPNLDEIIGRLNAFDEAGADVLYAPGLEDLDSIRTVISEISKPFNVLMMDTELTYGVKELADIGVKRISVGSVFAQLAYGSMIAAAREIVNQGSFGFIQEAMGYEDLEAYFK
jgi:2-methylisocitrate lyase-like PEP mutase family enzyme